MMTPMQKRLKYTTTHFYLIQFLAEVLNLKYNMTLGKYRSMSISTHAVGDTSMFRWEYNYRALKTTVLYTI